MSLTPEEIEKNYARYCNLLDKTGERAPALKALVEKLGVRLAIAPASSRKEHHNAFAGGLVEHSLRVLGNAMRIISAFDWNVPKDSLIIASLLHDLGKVGYAEQGEDLYVPQTDSWRAEKLGEEYTYNKAIQFMTVPQRSLFLCQEFGVKLTKDETLAILIHDGQYVDENKPYGLKEPLLATVLQMADYIAMRQEKGEFE